LNFTVEQVKDLSDTKGIISSSMIREALSGGRIEDANNWLGYNYTLRGYVIEGRKIGREMGFPTANIKPANDYKLVPGNGVYAVEVKIDGLNLQGMLSVGSNPTIPGLSGRRSIEVHIFDFERDIYDKEIEVIFRYRLRDEKKFGSIDQLTHQMELDKQKALTLLT
jgi:riboflavin kinase/FMN adenylyltransferase